MNSMKKERFDGEYEKLWWKYMYTSVFVFDETLILITSVSLFLRESTIYKRLIM